MKKIKTYILVHNIEKVPAFVKLHLSKQHNILSLRKEGDSIVLHVMDDDTTEVEVTFHLFIDCQPHNESDCLHNLSHEQYIGTVGTTSKPRCRVHVFKAYESQNCSSKKVYESQNHTPKTVKRRTKKDILTAFKTIKIILDNV